MYKISVDGNVLKSMFETMKDALAWSDIIQAKDEKATIEIFLYTRTEVVV